MMLFVKHEVFSSRPPNFFFSLSFLRHSPFQLPLLLLTPRLFWRAPLSRMRIRASVRVRVRPALSRMPPLLSLLSALALLLLLQPVQADRMQLQLQRDHGTALVFGQPRIVRSMGQKQATNEKERAIEAR